MRLACLCCLKTLDGFTAALFIVLFVDEADLSEPVKRSSLSPQVTLVEGDNIVLPCVFNANPVPSLTWNKYLGELPQDRSRLILGE